MEIKITRNNCEIPAIFAGKHYILIKEYGDENKIGLMFEVGDKVEVLLNGPNNVPFIVITKEIKKNESSK
jgi:hypothetical protein